MIADPPDTNQKAIRHSFARRDGGFALGGWKIYLRTKGKKKFEGKP